MRCYLCGKEIRDGGNDPFPLCSKDDNESRCCVNCFEGVVRDARLNSSTSDNRDRTNVKSGDMLVIYWAKFSERPVEVAKEGEHQFLTGTVENVIEKDGKRYASGSWGDFPVRLDEDSWSLVS